MSALVRERYFFAANPHSVLVSNMFYQGIINNENLTDKICVWAALNSTITYFFQETIGRPNIGGRLNFYGPEFRHLVVPNPDNILKYAGKTEVKELFEQFSFTQITKLSNEFIKPEREKMDDMIRCSIGIPPDLWSEMCSTFSEMVENRTTKEKSL